MIHNKDPNVRQKVKRRGGGSKARSKHWVDWKQKHNARTRDTRKATKRERKVQRKECKRMDKLIDELGIDATNHNLFL